MAKCGRSDDKVATGRGKKPVKTRPIAASWALNDRCSPTVAACRWVLKLAVRTRTTSNFLKQPWIAFQSNVLNQPSAKNSTSASTKATPQNTFSNFCGVDITNLTSNRVAKKSRNAKPIRDSKRDDGLLSERILGSTDFVGYWSVGKRKQTTI